MARQLDVGIISMRIDHRHFEAEPLISLPLVCVMPTGHRLAKKNRITPRDLVKQDFHHFGEGSHTRSNLHEEFSKAGLAPKFALDPPLAPSVCATTAGARDVRNEQ